MKKKTLRVEHCVETYVSYDVEILVSDDYDNEENEDEFKELPDDFTEQVLKQLAKKKVKNVNTTTVDPNEDTEFGILHGDEDED